jgi:DNA modification methylase
MFTCNFVNKTMRKFFIFDHAAEYHDDAIFAISNANPLVPKFLISNVLKMMLRC